MSKIRLTYQGDLRILEVDGRTIISKPEIGDETWLELLSDLGHEVEVVREEGWYNIRCTTCGSYISENVGNSNGKFIDIMEKNFRFMKVLSERYTSEYKCKIHLENMKDFVRLRTLLDEELILSEDNTIEIYNDYRE